MIVFTCNTLIVAIHITGTRLLYRLLYRRRLDLTYRNMASKWFDNFLLIMSELRQNRVLIYRFWCFHFISRLVIRLAELSRVHISTLDITSLRPGLVLIREPWLTDQIMLPHPLRCTWTIRTKLLIDTYTDFLTVRKFNSFTTYSI